MPESKRDTATANTKYDKQLEELLEKLRTIDLTDDIYYENPNLEALGGNSDVFKAKSRKHGNVEVAVKRLRVHILKQKNISKVLLRELSVWYGLMHPNILPLLGYVMHGQYPALVSRWMVKGSLREYIDSKLDPGFSKITMARGISAGLMYLHNQDIIHADLKGENIFISDSGEPVLADFGVSRVMISGGISSSNLSFGTVMWMAIELIEVIGPTNPDNPDDVNVHKHSKKSDMWAFGMVIYELLTGRLPFGHLGNNVIRFCFAIVSGLLPPIPALFENGDEILLWAISQRCWNRNPVDRPGVDWAFDTLSDAIRLKAVGIPLIISAVNIPDSSGKEEVHIGDVGYCGRGRFIPLPMASISEAGEGIPFQDDRFREIEKWTTIPPSAQLEDSYQTMNRWNPEWNSSSIPLLRPPMEFGVRRKPLSAVLRLEIPSQRLSPDPRLFAPHPHIARARVGS